MNRWNKYYQEHGYYEWKSLGNVVCKYTYNNRTPLGYGEMYHENGKIKYKVICI